MHEQLTEFVEPLSSQGHDFLFLAVLPFHVTSNERLRLKMRMEKKKILIEHCVCVKSCRPAECGVTGVGDLSATSSTDGSLGLRLFLGGGGRACLRAFTLTPPEPVLTGASMNFQLFSSTIAWTPDPVDEGSCCLIKNMCDAPSLLLLQLDHPRYSTMVSQPSPFNPIVYAVTPHKHPYLNLLRKHANAFIPRSSFSCSL